MDKGFKKPAVCSHSGVLYSREKEASTGHVTVQMTLANRMQSESNQTRAHRRASVRSRVQDRSVHGDGAAEWLPKAGWGRGEWVLTGTGLPPGVKGLSGVKTDVVVTKLCRWTKC